MWQIWCFYHKSHNSVIFLHQSAGLLLQITREWKAAESWLLVRLFVYQSFIASQILDFIHWMVYDFQFCSNDWWKPIIALIDSREKIDNGVSYSKQGGSVNDVTCQSCIQIALIAACTLADTVTMTLPRLFCVFLHRFRGKDRLLAV